MQTATSLVEEDPFPKERPRLLVVNQEFGTPSQVWIERQLRGFRQFRPHLVYWEAGLYRDAAAEGLETTEIGDWAAPVMRHDWRRWLTRAANLPTGNSLAAHGRNLRRLEALARGIAPCVILAHFGPTALHLLPVARRLGLRLVVHFHGHDLSSSLRRNRWYRRSLETQLRHFAAAIVVGEHQRDLVRGMGFAEHRLHLIPCGVPVAEFPLRQEDPGGPFRFVAVARLEPQKGFDVTLQAFAEVRARLPAAELHIVGDGHERRRLEQRATELGIAKQVTFHGFRTTAGVARQMRRSHVFLQHSLELGGWVEGFGVSAAEAASTGLAVVVSDCGGLRDQVVDGITGFIVPQRDSHAMATAMLRLAEDPALAARMGQAARRHMQANYDTKRQIARLEDVLQSAAQRDPADGKSGVGRTV